MNIFLCALFSSFSICFSLVLPPTLFLFASPSLSPEPWGLSSPSPQRRLSGSQARTPSTQQQTGDRSSVSGCSSREDLMSMSCSAHTSLVRSLTHTHTHSLKNIWIFEWSTNWLKAVCLLLVIPFQRTTATSGGLLCSSLFPTGMPPAPRCC